MGLHNNEQNAKTVPLERKPGLQQLLEIKEYGVDRADLLHVSTVNEWLTQGGTNE